MNHENSSIIARSDYGFVRQCLAGCVHLTFASITMHFGTACEFEALIDLVESEERVRAVGNGLEISYGWHTMALDEPASRALVDLLRMAREEIAWRHGRLTLTDDGCRRLLGLPPTSPRQIWMSDGA